MTNFLFLLILLGSLQGLIMGALLWFGKEQRNDRKILALILWIIALPGIHLYLHHVNFFAAASMPDVIHALVPWMMLMALGPLIYGYVRSVTDPSFSFTRIRVLTCGLLVIDLFPKIFELGLISGLFDGMLDRQAGEELINGYQKYADLPRWISFAAGVFISYRFLKTQGPTLRLSITSEHSQPLWLSRFLIVFAVVAGIWLLYLVPYLLPLTSTSLLNTVGWFPVYIPLAVMMYWLGIHGYQSNMASPPVAVEPDKSVPLKGKTIEGKNEADAGWLSEVTSRLILAMENDRLFLDPDLDLQRLAVAVGLPGKLISTALNQQLQKPVRLFINQYRVEEFKRLANSEALDTLTIASLAKEAGFSSPATFQRVFRQLQGMSPTEFLQQADRGHVK